jgi:hypothetical protein
MLKDPEVIPTDRIIESLVGERIKLWTAVLGYASENMKDVSGSWNYYKDGKQWLFKLVQKKKTILWAGIFDGNFRVTFYFGDKAEPVIDKSELPAGIIKGFKNAKRYGAIRPITMILTNHSDIEIVYLLMHIKSNIK